MSEDVMKAVTEVKTAFEAFKEANDARLKEMEAKGAADPVTEEKLAKIEADLEKAQRVADEAALAAKRQSRVVTDEKGNAVDLDAKAMEWAEQIARKRGDRAEPFDAKGMAAYRGALRRYMQKGEQLLGAEEMKALSVGSDQDGGYVVTPDTSGRIVQRVYETSPMRAYASVQVISTDALEGLFDLDEAAGSWVAETAARPETSTPKLGQWRIPVHELSAFPFATQKLLDDASINMETWLADKVADKFARAEATAFVTGDGIGKPRGFLTYPNGTTLPGTIEQVPTGVSGGYAAAPNGGDVLIDALYSLKAQYRANATWFMNRATAKLTRKLKDSDGAYLWAPGIAAGQPATILGYPLAAFEDMPDPGASSLSVAVGDMRAAYQIVDRIGIRVLRDALTNKPFVGFYSTKRVGGDVVNFEALKLIRFNS